MATSQKGHSKVVQLLLTAHATVNAQNQVRLEIYVAMCILYPYASSICCALLAMLASRDALLLSAEVPAEYLELQSLFLLKHL